MTGLLKDMIMRGIPLFVALTLVLSAYPAQTAEPVRLAVIAESPDAGEASDLLTAQLSGNTNVQLLERNQINQIYHEQSLSAGNRDDIKIGQLLGADGLVLMDVIPQKVKTFSMGAPLPIDLRVRVIAVKPGVVLASQTFTVSQNELSTWTGSYASHLDPLLPKLSLLVKDAIPISLVNFRFATQSTDAAETERAIALLTVERLSQERQFFVLERQHMARLADEKELKSDNAPFWNGSYLLDGVIDKNGYDKDTITISAALTPPKGAAPISIDVSGSRTNFAEVINRLATRVAEATKVTPSAPMMTAAEEAAKFYTEGAWALKWRAFSQSQEASEAAWALGKHDLDCAILRVKAYMLDAEGIKNQYDTLESTVGPTYNGSGQIVSRPGNALLQQSIKSELRAHPFGAVYSIETNGDIRIIHFTYAEGPGSARYLNLENRGLNYYRQFSDTLTNAGQDMDNWYHLGIDCLATAGRILQYYNFFPQQGQALGDDIAGLRAIARSTVEMMESSPRVHNSYFVGSRVVTHDELADSMHEYRNLFSCEIKWGCYWQEKPEDTIAMYRELMSSPVFSYVHKNFWLRPNHDPRIVAWNESDSQHIPSLWSSFMQDLADSPDILHQLESKAIAFVDADNDDKKGAAFTNLFSSLILDRAALLTNNVEVLYLKWGIGDLVEGSGIVTPLKEELGRSYRSTYAPQLADMEGSYWRTVIPARKSDGQFQKRKEYLLSNKSYNFPEFARLFGPDDFTKAQALELQPLIAAYLSNITAQAEQAPQADRFKLRSGISFIKLISNNIARAAISTETKPLAQFRPVPMQPQRPATNTAAESLPPTTNIVLVDRFLAIPSASLRLQDVSNDFGGATIVAHQWLEGKLVLNLLCGAVVYSFDSHGHWAGTSNATYSAIAVMDPKSDNWNIVTCPRKSMFEVNLIYNQTTLLNGVLYNSEGRKIEKYDSDFKKWKQLDVSDGNNYALYNVNGHLYAANNNAVMEILNEGSSSRLMASGRRQPPVSALDQMDLKTPIMFSGPENSLRIVAAGKLFSWTGTDWRNEQVTALGVVERTFNPAIAGPFTRTSPQILPEGVLFVSSGVSRLPMDSNNLELCLKQKKRTTPHATPQF